MDRRLNQNLKKRTLKRNKAILAAVALLRIPYERRTINGLNLLSPPIPEEATLAISRRYD